MGDKELSESIKKQIQANELEALNSGIVEKTAEIEHISPETILRETAVELRSNMIEKYNRQRLGGKIIQFVDRNKVNLDYEFTAHFDEDFMKFTQKGQWIAQIQTPIIAEQMAPTEAIRYGWKAVTFVGFRIIKDTPLLIYRVGQSLSNPDIESRELWYTIFPPGQNNVVRSECNANDVGQDIYAEYAKSRNSSPEHVERCLGVVQEALSTLKF